MSRAGLRDRLNHRIGEQIFLSALDGVPEPDHRPLLWVFAKGTALAILIVPWCVLAAGLALGYLGFPHILPLGIAAILIGLAWYLRPRRLSTPEDALGPDALPQTFAAIAQIAERLGAPPLLRIAVSEDFNCSVSNVRGTRCMTIGAPLWMWLTDDEKTALVAHELGHFVNGDPLRSGVSHQALATLERWENLVEPHRYVDPHTGVLQTDRPDVVTEILQIPLRLLVDLLMRLMLHLFFLPSQRAEYLADALSARVAGKDANRALLRKTLLSDELFKRWNACSPRPKETAVAFLERLVAEAETISAADRARIEQAQAKVLLSVDETHPPTTYRLAFLDTLDSTGDDTPPLKLAWGAADAELAPQFARVAERLIARHEVQ